MRSIRSSHSPRSASPSGRPSFWQTSVVEALRLQCGGTRYTSGTSSFEITASGSTSAKRAILSRISVDSGSCRAADDDVRVDTDAAQLVHRVLRRLRLQLARRIDERNQRDVEVEHVLLPDLAAELANRLEERQRLDVADRPADLGDHDVGVGRLRGAPDPLLDLVRDVRDDLNRRAEVLALPLLAKDAVPDRAGGVIRVRREVLVEEPLVVADVEVRLRPVLRHEDLAVLERAHRPGSTLRYGSNF
jgi:hypothetical protein